MTLKVEPNLIFKMTFKRSSYDEVKPDSKGDKRSKKSEGSNHLPDSNNKYDIDELHKAPCSKVERCESKVSANKSKKKLLKEFISKNKDSVGELTNGVPKLLITSLPHSVNKSTLKEVFPLATRVKLSKKASSRYAFLDFSSSGDYSDAMKRLESLEFCGVKPNYRIIVGSDENVIKSQNTKQLANKPNCLRIRNLPYSLTLNEIKAEFPLADQIHLDVNKLGIFNGSCILEMKSNDDLQAVLNQCKHKYIGDRLVRAEAQCTMKTQSSKPVDPNASFGLRLKEVPNVIKDSYIKGLFPKDSVVGLSSRSVQDSNTRNVFIFFKNNAQRKSALKMFKNEVIMGYPISCRLWGMCIELIN
ncbi:unnamed protein product [Trichobilharzia szidati]|nr:unnamed protein product [Trichobilharzia szidati]